MNTMIRGGMCKQAEFFAPTMSQLLEDITKFIEMLEERAAEWNGQIYAALTADTHPDPTLGLNNFYGRLLYEFTFDNWRNIEAVMATEKKMWEMVKEQQRVKSGAV